jgi:hypothetical protein
VPFDGGRDESGMRVDSIFRLASMYSFSVLEGDKSPMMRHHYDGWHLDTRSRRTTLISLSPSAVAAGKEPAR